MEGFLYTNQSKINDYENLRFLYHIYVVTA